MTRGSFYWHFSVHAGLPAALLAQWRQREIDEDLALQAQATADPQADSLALLDQALSRRNDGLRRLRFELALRGLGRRDAGVAERLAEVDAARMALFEAKLLRLTRTPGPPPSWLPCAARGAAAACRRWPGRPALRPPPGRPTSSAV